jgi:predicted DNA-binding transcriptional regulator YafY
MGSGDRRDRLVSATSDRAPASRAGRRRVPGDEIRRILALVPFLVAHPGIAKRDVADRFGLTLDELDADLDLVLMIGVPPFSGGDYIDVDDDGEHVTLLMAESFRRPVRLSPAEGLALLAAGRALLAVPGAENDGPLASALGKLEVALGSPELVVQLAAPTHLDAVRSASDERRSIEIEYHGATRDEPTTRVIDPVTVFCAAGEWYGDAFCHRADAERLFRIDRIRAVRPLGSHFVPRDDDATVLDVYRPRADDPRVTIDLTPRAHWVAERYPIESQIQRDNGNLRVTLAITEPEFLARLMLRLGSTAAIVDPPQWRSIALDPARRILDRYGAAANRPSLGNRQPQGDVGAAERE